jgi:hypothetical protein
MRRRTNPVLRYDAGLPKALGGAPAHDHEGRRRFLKQLAAGAGAVGLGAVPRLGHGQSAAVDFSVLDRHPPTVVPVPALTAEPPPSPPALPAQALAAEPAPLDLAAGPVGAAGVAAAPAPDPVEVAEPTELAEPGGPPPPATAPQESVMITENRALWLEPGYLVLLRWVRAEDDTRAVALLEGSAAALSEFLTTRVRSVDDLHDLARLHALEGELLALLYERMPTGTIEVLHLNHDCTTVCPSLEPGRLPGIRPEYPLPGGI